MSTIAVTIPSMLATLVKGERRFTIEAESIQGALEALFRRHPELRVHLLDERGELRDHVMLFHNDRAVRLIVGTLEDGDTLTVLQAVSGGSPGEP